MAAKEVRSKYIYIYIYIYSLISKAESQRERQAEREIVHLLVYFPNIHNSKDLARPKPEARISIQVLHKDGRKPSTWGNISCLPGCTLARRCTGSVQQLVCESGLPIWESGIPSNGLKLLCTTVSAPRVCFSFNISTHNMQ